VNAAFSIVYFPIIATAASVNKADRPVLTPYRSQEPQELIWTAQGSPNDLRTKLQHGFRELQSATTVVAG
jgi:hypothetical protein